MPMRPRCKNEALRAAEQLRKQVVAHRHARGLSQEAAAALMGVPQSRWSVWERTSTNTDTLLAMLAALGVVVTIDVTGRSSDTKPESTTVRQDRR